MDIISVGLLESGSTMPNRGIALPLDPSFLVVAGSCPFDPQTLNESPLAPHPTHHPQPLLFLATKCSVSSYAPSNVEIVFWAVRVVVFAFPLLDEARARGYDGLAGRSFIPFG